MPCEAPCPVNDGEWVRYIVLAGFPILPVQQRVVQSRLSAKKTCHAASALSDTCGPDGKEALSVVSENRRNGTAADTLEVRGIAGTVPSGRSDFQSESA